MKKNIIKISDPEIRIKCEIVRLKEFTKFSLTKEFALYMYLASWAIRGPRWTGKFKLYENFYLKGFIPSRWSQKALGEHFEVSQQTISRWARNLQKHGLIKIIKKTIHGKPCNIYVLGTVTHPSKKETLFFDIIFKKLVKKYQLECLLTNENTV